MFDRLSIRQRLIGSATILLSLFLVLAGLAIDRLYTQHSTQSLQRELNSHLYALLGSVGIDRNGLPVMTSSLPTPAMNIPGSGLYAAISNNLTAETLYSGSFNQQVSSFLQSQVPGSKHFSETDTLMALNYGVDWEDNAGTAHTYTFSIASDMKHLRQQLTQFRTELTYWLSGSIIVLGMIQLFALRWAINPLKQASAEIQNIKQGKQDLLQNHYPPELQELTSNLNALIEHGHANQERYRKSLGDLAHSLKTPLAIMQGARETNNPNELMQTTDQQLPRINELISYQLQRASFMGKRSLSQSVSLKPVIEKVLRGLDKVYRDKNIQTSFEIDEQTLFAGDESDLMELIGNLLDNAYKYGQNRVNVTARQQSGQLLIQIEDDGKGIADQQKQKLMQRGVRADEKTPGQGLGLDIVNEIIKLYDASLTITQSGLGGAKFILEFDQQL